MQKILIVDDQDVIRKLVNSALSSHGYEVIEAANGQEGFQAAKKNKPDCIILDVNMPGELNGIEVCKKLRKKWAFKKTTILMLSANTQETDKNLGMEAGATDYLVKPFSPEYLLAQIKSYLA